MWQTKADKIRKIKKNVCKLSLHLLYSQFSLMMTLSQYSETLNTNTSVGQQTMNSVWLLRFCHHWTVFNRLVLVGCGGWFSILLMWTVMLWKLPIGFHRLWLWPHWSHGSQPTFHSCTFSAQGYQNNSLIRIQCECVGVKGGENQN